MSKVDVVVLIEESRRSSIDQIASSLEEKGLTIKDKLPRFRTILGSGDSSRIDEMIAVDGVEAVRPEKKFQLPPMDEKIPQ
jgi:hypothetical protein